NEEMGKITGPLDKTESWFAEYGDSKGLCFNADGSKILVTFESDKQLSIVEKIFLSFALDKDLPLSAKLLKLSFKSISTIRKGFLQKAQSANNTLKRVRANKSIELERPKHSNSLPTKKPAKNGIAVFSINEEGKIARSPDQVIMR